MAYDKQFIKKTELKAGALNLSIGYGKEFTLVGH